MRVFINIQAFKKFSRRCRFANDGSIAEKDWIEHELGTLTSFDVSNLGQRHLPSERKEATSIITLTIS
jgi:hypothetical protein